MKVALLITVLLATACPSGGGTPPSPVVTTAIDCGTEAIVSTAADHLSEVERALLESDWKSAVAKIGVNIGKDVLACIIEHIVNASSKDFAYSNDRNAATKIENGKQWIADERITFKKEP